MIRILSMTVAIFCTATMVTIAGLIGWIALKGHVDKEEFADLKAIVLDQPRPSQLKVEVEPVEEPRIAGFEEISRQRVMKIMELENRQQEIESLKQNIDLQLESVLKQQQQLQAIKDALRKELEQSQKSITSESMEQARSIVLKMNTDSAVSKIMALDNKEAIAMIKGMGEKDAARILEKFKGGELGVKGNEIFQAITRGEPMIQSVNNAQNQLRP